MKNFSILLIAGLLIVSCGQRKYAGKYQGTEQYTQTNPYGQPFNETATVEIVVQQGSDDTISGTWQSTSQYRGTSTGNFTATERDGKLSNFRLISNQSSNYSAGINNGFPYGGNGIYPGTGVYPGMGVTGGFFNCGAMTETGELMISENSLSGGPLTGSVAVPTASGGLLPPAQGTNQNQGQCTVQRSVTATKVGGN